MTPDSANEAAPPAERPSRRRAARLLSIGAGLSLAILAAACGPPELKPPVAVGLPAPSFRLQNLEGGTVETSSLAGKPALVNFWATWCQPCRKEEPELAALANGGKVEVVAIALDEEGAEAVGPYVAEHSLPFGVLLGNQETFQRFGGYAIPYSLLLDAEGTVLQIYRGPVTRQEVEQALAAGAGG